MLMQLARLVTVVFSILATCLSYLPFPSQFEKLWHRNEIAELAQGLNLTIGVEVGVQRGQYAKAMLTHWPSCKFYVLVDLWHHQANYFDKANVDEDQQLLNYKAAKENLFDWKDKVVFYRDSSINAAKYFANESVDFVYLDARHDYCGVTEDLQAWYPKLRIGGFMAGHDFLTAGQASSMSFGSENWEECANGKKHGGAVKGAVQDFARKHSLNVYCTFDKPPSWYFSRKEAPLQDDDDQY